MATDVYGKLLYGLMRMKKGLGIFRKVVTRRTTTVVAISMVLLWCVYDQRKIVNFLLFSLAYPILRSFVLLRIRCGGSNFEELFDCPLDFFDKFVA